MIVPSAVDVLRSIGETFDSVILPSLSGVTERSAGATISHLLRHVTLRIELEGQLLSEDMARLNALLASIRDYCRECDRPGAEAERQQIEAVLAANPATARPYFAVGDVAAGANALRQALARCLAFLASIRASERDNPAYRELRERIRSYMAQQLRDEALLIDPAFEGRGARR